MGWVRVCVPEFSVRPASVHGGSPVCRRGDAADLPHITAPDSAAVSKKKPGACARFVVLVKTTDYQPISFISGSVMSFGGVKVSVRSELMFGSISRLGNAVTSQCDTDEPAASVDGV